MRIIFLAAGLALFITGCGGSKHSDNVTPVPPAPKAATLVFPAQNAVCVSGTVISAAQSTILFQWDNGLNAGSYTVITKDLLTGDSLATNTGSNSAAVSLNQNTPYSWYVVSRSDESSSTAKSATWKFYNSGSGITTYAPFPADHLSPAAGQAVTVPSSGTITLSWQGTSVDHDIVDYDVYFGTALSPPLYQSHVTAQQLSGVVLSPGTAYYWQVVTRDSNHNTSTSDVAAFTTN